MKVVIVGQGGREHALAKHFTESNLVSHCVVIPGNAGISTAGIECVELAAPKEIAKYCIQQKVDMVVIGPEAMILSELKKLLDEAGVFCVSPSIAAAKLETSKEYCKSILEKAGIKTAKMIKISNPENAESQLHYFYKDNGAKICVVKANGLAQGKGVVIATTKEDAKVAIHNLSKQYGFPILLEEFLQGRELSAFAVCDGEDFVEIGTACDYKRINQDVKSANTGGMGAYSPCDFITNEDKKKITAIFINTLKTLKSNGIHYQGFLFAGLMKCEDDIYVIEFNVRMGDPETQALLPRLKTNLAEILLSVKKNELKNVRVSFDPFYSVHVVATSGGYPGSNLKLGYPIEIEKQNINNYIFAGVKRRNDCLINSSGRVIGTSGVAQSKEEARAIAYKHLDTVQFKEMYYRKDIAQ